MKSWWKIASFLVLQNCSILAVQASQSAGVSCLDLNSKNAIGYNEPQSEFFLFESVLTDGIPPDCFPDDRYSNVYASWYKLLIPGTPGTTLDTHVYTWSSGTTLPHSIALMEGSCGSLTCAALQEAVDISENIDTPGSPPIMQSYVRFTLSTNTPYYLFSRWKKSQTPTSHH